MHLNTLYFGDNLQVLREHFPDECVDLVYLDPPFNSKRDYNYIYRDLAGAGDTAQEQAFSDTWTFAGAAAEFREVTESGFPEGKLIDALHEVFGDTSLVAYLSVMALRLRELRRILKPTGSLYLHCDPTAGHYLKMVLDCVLGSSAFRSEVVWSYRRWPTRTPNYQHMHDLIYYYARGQTVTFNVLYEPPSESFLKRFRGMGNRLDRGATTKRSSDEPTPGLPMRDVWDLSILAGSSSERLGYPTQKPLALLNRIIAASSNEGDVVLDPFCGCGTAVVAAQKLGRRWCGIDITSLSVTLMRQRLADSFPEIYPSPGDVPVIGLPKDLAGARLLAELDKYDFQFWALTLVGAHPPGGTKKKGADKGVDGEILWRDGTGKLQKAVVSVKGGQSVTDTQLKDLITTVDAAKAAVGLFVSLAQPTGPMRNRAALGGNYTMAGTAATYPRIQMLTIEELLAGKRPDLPKSSRLDPHKSARAVDDGTQGSLFGE
ncbi:MAG: hypothetical protein IT204_21780 [Fimbriimonadaceae bacterium]|nr:hypothetical protein [Fimbriimonadaceae bacterium]